VERNVFEIAVENGGSDDCSEIEHDELRRNNMFAVKFHQSTIEITYLTDPSSQEDNDERVDYPEFVNLNKLEGEKGAEAFCGQDGETSVECTYADINKYPFSAGIASREHS